MEVNVEDWKKYHPRESKCEPCCLAHCVPSQRIVVRFCATAYIANTSGCFWLFRTVGSSGRGSWLNCCVLMSDRSRPVTTRRTNFHLFPCTLWTDSDFRMLWCCERRIVDTKLVSHALPADDRPIRRCTVIGRQHRYRWKCCRNTPDTQYRATGLMQEFRKLAKKDGEWNNYVTFFLVLYIHPWRYGSEQTERGLPWLYIYTCMLIDGVYNLGTWNNYS